MMGVCVSGCEWVWWECGGSGWVSDGSGWGGMVGVGVHVCV